LLIGKLEKKKPSGRTRHGKINDNIKMDLGETVRQDVNWVHLAEDMDHWETHISTSMNLRVS
jgi:3-phenylpropionate/cinnamic acid dioxygenase small subunit